jgi:hypothetical protein
VDSNLCVAFHGRVDDLGIDDDDSSCNKARRVSLICIYSRGFAVDLSFRVPELTANGRESTLM